MSSEERKNMNKYLYRVVVLLTVLAVVLPVTSALSAEEKEWKSLKKDDKREQIDERADENLAALLEKSSEAQELFETAYGWAAFHNLKLAVGVTAGGGKGVAVGKATGDRIYMEMGTAGVGASLGGQKYDVIFLFETEQNLRHFVENGWQADASANAVAGESGVNKQTAFVNGLAIYQMTDGGLMVNADIAGTKYWKDGKLNND